MRIVLVNCARVDIIEYEVAEQPIFSTKFSYTAKNDLKEKRMSDKMSGTLELPQRETV